MTLRRYLYSGLACLALCSGLTGFASVKSASSARSVEVRGGTRAMSVEISPANITLAPGATQLFSLNISGTNNYSASWTCDGGDLTKTGQAMLYTAPTRPGNYTIVANVSNKAGETKTVAANITVKVDGVSVSIVPNDVILALGAKMTFQATVSGSSNTEVKWSVLEADGGEINDEGVYIAPNKPGTYTVKATSKADTTKSATAKVRVGTSNVSISIDPTSVTLAPNETQLFSVRITGTNDLSSSWTANDGGSLTNAEGGMRNGDLYPLMVAN